MKFRTSGLLGPVIVTGDALLHPDNLRIKTRLNEAAMQDAHTAYMSFSLPHIINHLSEFFDLEAGEVTTIAAPSRDRIHAQTANSIQTGRPCGRQDRPDLHAGGPSGSPPLTRHAH